MGSIYAVSTLATLPTRPPANALLDLGDLLTYGPFDGFVQTTIRVLLVPIDVWRIPFRFFSITIVKVPVMSDLGSQNAPHLPRVVRRVLSRDLLKVISDEFANDLSVSAETWQQAAANDNGNGSDFDHFFDLWTNSVGRSIDRTAAT